MYKKFSISVCGKRQIFLTVRLFPDVTSTIFSGGKEMVAQTKSLVFTEVKLGFFVQRFGLPFTHETQHLKKRE